ncbi:MAG: hypothetical protein ACJAYY_000301 [Paraglaciecola sp.]|jgi:hypothetical protein
MTDGIDLTKSIYRFQNISILSIQIAIYMGFKEIYLVGLDHDWILRMFDKSHMHFLKKKQAFMVNYQVINGICR